ncbi:MurR/RpiR family transcriptional regulator [Halobacillus rhizosphaerae]|uniref:MurR/RpiR family transcriptional regulator n=1 Tax=Halobacillus rhizosphaerae TaxID=3064889 RepID=UPI00398ABF60
MDLKDRAHKYEYKLNDTDDQIINYILANKSEVIEISIQSLAKELYTVPNTITRLTKKLGYDGFSHLKNSLKDEIKSEEVGQESTIQYNIRRTVELMDEERLSSIVKVLRQAERVFVYGVGDTMPFCELFATHLKIGGKTAEFFLHRHDAVYAMNHATSKDVLFLLSMSGETEQILEMVKLAKDRKVTIVSLTHFSRNTLQEQSNLSYFFYSPRRMLENYNISDKTPVMLALQKLSERLWETS